MYVCVCEHAPVCALALGSWRTEKEMGWQMPKDTWNLVKQSEVPQARVPKVLESCISPLEPLLPHL